MKIGEHMTEGWLPGDEARYIEIGGLRVEETLKPDGARFVITGQRATCGEIAYLAKKLVGWFADVDEDLVIARDKIVLVIDELEEWNDRARADEEHPPYEELTRALATACAALERMGRVFGPQVEP